MTIQRFLRRANDSLRFWRHHVILKSIMPLFKHRIASCFTTKENSDLWEFVLISINPSGLVLWPLVQSISTSHLRLNSSQDLFVPGEHLKTDRNTDKLLFDRQVNWLASAVADWLIVSSLILFVNQLSKTRPHTEPLQAFHEHKCTLNEKANLG